MPSYYIGLATGCEDMSDALDALCFIVIANSIFYGEKLLNADNSNPEGNRKMMSKMSLSDF